MYIIVRSLVALVLFPYLGCNADFQSQLFGASLDGAKYHSRHERLRNLLLSDDDILTVIGPQVTTNEIKFFQAPTNNPTYPDTPLYDYVGTQTVLHAAVFPGVPNFAIAGAGGALNQEFFNILNAALPAGIAQGATDLAAAFPMSHQNGNYLRCLQTPGTGFADVCAKAASSTSPIGTVGIIKYAASLLNNQPQNIFMIYAVGPDNSIADAAFLDTVESTSKNMLDAVKEYNFDKSKPDINVVRIPLFSATDSKPPTIPLVDIAKATLSGIADSLRNVTAGVTMPTLEFTYASDSFNMAWDSVSQSTTAAPSSTSTSSTMPGGSTSVASTTSGTGQMTTAPMTTASGSPAPGSQDPSSAWTPPGMSVYTSIVFALSVLVAVFH